MEPAQLHHTINEQIGIVQQQQSQSHQQTKADKQKCISCGGHIQNAKRKGPKLIRCETCIQNDTNAQNVRPTQIFVSQDGDIKFEVNEGQNVIQIQNTALPAKVASKKKNVTTVTKCTTCNGTGVVIVTDNHSAHQTVATTVSSQQQQQQQQATIAVQSSKSSTVQRPTASPQKISHQVQLQTITHQQAISPPPLQQAQHHPVQHHAPPQNQSAQSQNDKPFSCNICGGKFSRYSSLWSHKKLHSGEKNYKVYISLLFVLSLVVLINLFFLSVNNVIRLLPKLCI